MSAAPTPLVDAQGQPVQLLLYMKPSCPYCHRVLAAIEALDYVVPQSDVGADTAARTRLLTIGGKATVPCLFVNDRPMYESAAIVDYLEEQVRPAPTPA